MTQKNQERIFTSSKENNFKSYVSMRIYDFILNVLKTFFNLDLTGLCHLKMTLVSLKMLLTI